MFLAFSDVFLQHFPTPKNALIFNKMHNIKHLHTKKQSQTTPKNILATHAPAPSNPTNTIQFIHNQITTKQKHQLQPSKNNTNANLTHSSANITNTIDSSFPPLNDIKPKTEKTNQTNKSKLTQQNSNTNQNKKCSIRTQSLSPCHQPDANASSYIIINKNYHYNSILIIIKRLIWQYCHK